MINDIDDPSTYEVISKKEYKIIEKGICPLINKKCIGKECAFVISEINDLIESRAGGSTFENRYTCTKSGKLVAKSLKTVLWKERNIKDILASESLG